MIQYWLDKIIEKFFGKYFYVRKKCDTMYNNGTAADENAEHAPLCKARRSRNV